MRKQVLVAVLTAGLLSGCAVRTQFQGCVIRCPDMTKDPDQIEAEGERATRIARVSVAQATQWAPLAPLRLYNVTDDAPVTGSWFVVTATTPTLLTSRSGFSVAAGTNTYRVEAKKGTTWIAIWGAKTYYQLAALAIASGLVAGVAGGLIAQPAGNTGHPGTVTIGDTSAAALDVAGGAEFGSGDVALIGTDGRLIGPLSDTILTDLSGANLTGLNGSRITTGTVAAGRIANLSAAKITSGTLARARLGFGQNSAEGSTDTLIAMNDYSFYPNWRGCSGSAATMKGRDVTNPSGLTPTGYFFLDLDGSCVGATTWIAKWAYLSASDRPSVWVVVDATGEIVALWEGEDPISADDTVSPLATDDPTHRAVNMGVPSLAVITSLSDVLTADQQTDLLTRLDAYVAVERGWLDAVTTLADLATIAPRYEPSGRQWAMRLLAEVQGLAVAELYRTALRVDPLTDTWVVAPQ